MFYTEKTFPRPLTECVNDLRWIINNSRQRGKNTTYYRLLDTAEEPKTDVQNNKCNS